jgi:hypothetical protein
LLGTDNGDVADLTRAQSSQRRVFKGKCAGMIQATDQKGRVRVEVMPEGLKQETYHLRTI